MKNVLIVEDDVLVALDHEDIVTSIGFQVVGLASTYEHARSLAENADIALVDLQLADGFSGAEVGRMLAEEFGTTVLFVTGTPDRLIEGVPSTLGFMKKPVSPELLHAALTYASADRGEIEAHAPVGLILFQRVEC